MNIMEKFDKLIAETLALGVYKANIITTDMKYINGQNTVTYFGAVLFKENE